MKIIVTNGEVLKAEGNNTGTKVAYVSDITYSALNYFHIECRYGPFLESSHKMRSPGWPR